MSHVLRLITAGSVDDGKSTLIGRLLVETQAIMQDQLTAVQNSKYRRSRSEEPDLALFTDGLEDERAQGITIDVAYRYFATPNRKFIIADTPGHEQYTRNMVTGASTAQAAIILIDATRVHNGQLLPQTQRHSAIAQLLGIRHIIVAVNKMDLIDWQHSHFENIKKAYAQLAQELNIEHFYALPISALQGDNISTGSTNMPWYQGPTLLSLLESLPLSHTAPIDAPARLFVQWVIRHGGSSAQPFRGYAGQLLSGSLQVGSRIQVWPANRSATIKALWSAGQKREQVQAGAAITFSLKEDIDLARGDFISTANHPVTLAQHNTAHICWLDEQPLDPARPYWLKQGTQTTQIRIKDTRAVGTITDGHIATIGLLSRDPLIAVPYEQLPSVGSFILIDPGSHQTVAAGMLLQPED